MDAMTMCPCGSGRPGEECCEPLLRGETSAPTAVALMRSRYTAFVRRDEAYLRQTWHPRTRPRRVLFEAGLRWDRLEVIGQAGGSLFDSEGTVTFAAHYTMDGRPGVLREESQFVREEGGWLYIGPRSSER